MFTPLDEVDMTSSKEVRDAISFMRYNLVRASHCSNRRDFVDMARYLELAKEFVARAIANPAFGFSGSDSAMEVATVILPRYIRSFHELNADWAEINN